VGLIAYCCTRKEEEKVPVTDQEVPDNRTREEITEEITAQRAEQDTQDIDRIVPKVAEEIQNSYPNIKNCILYIYRDDPKYKGNVELQAILKWYFLLPAQNCYEGLPETNLCRQRESTKMDVEYDQARTDAAPGSSISTLFTNIETGDNCFIATTMTNMTSYEQALELRRPDSSMVHYAMQ